MRFRSLALVLLASHPALTAQEPALRAVPAEPGLLLIVRDVMPHAEALLRAPALRAVVAATAELQQELLGRRFDAATLERQLALVRPFVPVGVELVASTDTLTSLAHALHAATALIIGQVRLQNGTPREDLAPLRARLLASLQALQPLVAIARVTLRDERTAEQWFDQLAAVLAASAGGEGLAVATDDNRLELTLRPYALQQGRLSLRLRELGVDPAPLQEFAVRAMLVQAGPVLTLQLGEFAAVDLPAKQLGELFRPDPLQLLFGRLDCAAALDVGFEALELLGECEQEWESPLVMQVHALIDRFTDLAPHTAASLDVSAGVRWTTIEDHGDDVDATDLDLSAAEIVRCLDPLAGPFGLTAQPLDVVLSALGHELGNRLLQRADALGSEHVLDFFDRFGELFEFLDGEDSAVFEPGALVVFRGARCRRLELPRDGGPAVLQGMPFASFAIVAKAESAAAARDFVDHLVASVVEGLGHDAGHEPADANLGLGVPTRRIPWSGSLPRGIVLDADFDPHHAQAGEVMILSTDPALTRELLQRLRGAEAVRLPVARPVAWSRWTGGELAAVADGLGRWLGELPWLPPAEQRLGVQFGSAIAALAGPVEVLESLSLIDGSGRLRSTVTLQLRADAR